MEKLVAIVLMAGLSERFGGPTNKQLSLLKGKPVFEYSIETFANSKHIKNLVIVINKNNEEKIREFIKEKAINATITYGGKTRQESVVNGLNSLSLSENDIVIIHDGARPLVTEKDIENVAKEAKKYGASSTYVESIDTVSTISKNSEVKQFIERKTVALIQTPQAFKYGILVNAHKLAKNNDATDDCTLILNAKGKVKLVYGGNRLHKITTKEDILYLEGFLR